MSHGILVIKITRWVGIGWREGDQPKPCLDDISCGLGPLCAKWSLNTVREQLQLFSVLISPDSGFFLLFLFFQKIQYTISIYCIRCRSGQIFSSLCFEVTHMYRQYIYVYLHYRGVTFSQTNSPPQSLRAPSHNSTHVLICSRTVRGSSHGQSDHTLGQSVCDSWQSITISSWPTSSVTLTVYVCFMVIS